MAEDIWMIEAIIQPFKLDAVTLALEELPAFCGMTVSDCRGFGHEKLADGDQPADTSSRDAAPERRRSSDADFIDFTSKVKLEIVVVGRSAANLVADTIAAVAHTGRRGDGKIFVWPLARVVRVRTSEEGESAV